MKKSRKPMSLSKGSSSKILRTWKFATDLSRLIVANDLLYPKSRKYNHENHGAWKYRIYIIAWVATYTQISWNLWRCIVWLFWISKSISNYFWSQNFAACINFKVLIKVVFWKKVCLGRLVRLEKICIVTLAAVF